MKIITKFGVIFTLLSSVFIYNTSFAQEGASNVSSRVAIEEIVVTGTKRDIGQQDAAIAVSAITEQAFQNTFANDPRALSTLVPNLTLTLQPGFNVVSGGIRGTGSVSILVTEDPSVAFLVDDFGINHVQAQFVEMFDIEQIEVYRGPQGTLFGKNATGGVISITTKKPVLDEWSGEFSALAGQYDWNEGSKNKFKLGVNMPIIAGKVAMRIAAIWDKNQGYYQNSKPAGVYSPTGPFIAGDPTDGTNLSNVGDGGDLGGKDVLAAKIKFLFEPNASYSGHLIFEISKDDSATPAAVNETECPSSMLFCLLGFPGVHTPSPNWGDKTWDNVYATGESYHCNSALSTCKGHRMDTRGVYFNQTFELGDLTLKSITGYRNHKELNASTYTGEAYSSLYDATRNTDRTQIQQELRLTSNYDGPFNFTAGASYAEDNLNYANYAAVGLQWFFGIGNWIHNDYQGAASRQDRTSKAYYFDFSYDLKDDLRLSAGVRYTQDEKNFVREQGTNGSNALGRPNNTLSTVGLTRDDDPPQFFSPIPCENRAICVDNSDSWSETTYRFVLDYQVNDDVMIYGSLATGFMAGGYTETCSTDYSCAYPYEPETNTNIELGMKGDFLDGRLRLNIAVFNTEFEDLQRNQVLPLPVPPYQETVKVNAGKSTNRGIEIELNYLVTDNLRLDANVATQDHTYDIFVWDETPNDGIDNPTDFSGYDLPFSPDLSWALSLTYDQNLGDNGSLTYNISADYQDEAQTQPTNPIYSQMEDRTLINANVTWRDIGDQYWFTLYGKNLGDETYRVGSNSVAGLWNFTLFGAPMEYGVEAGVRW
ncbi:MAG: TonB-dependent receptor [Pseudomonadota bacterium]|nr:TonB-dependent receptor [Pseudomonadota bacterium]